jgi:pantothenate kinase
MYPAAVRVCSGIMTVIANSINKNLVHRAQNFWDWNIFRFYDDSYKKDVLNTQKILVYVRLKWYEAPCEFLRVFRIWVPNKIYVQEPEKIIS